MRTPLIALALALFPLSLFAQSGSPPPPAGGARPPQEKKEGQPKLRALIITGDDVPAHDWRETTPVVREILESSGRFEVRVSEEPAVLMTPALSGYDVVVLNYRDGDGRGPGEAARKGLRDFVASGKGLVALHFAVAAFRDWPDYQSLVGRVWVGKVSGHGPRGPFQVSISPGESPITSGLKDFTIDDELYSKLSGDAPIKVLATAHSDWSKQDEPMAWTLEVGRGRVFTTPLGHDGRSRRHPAFVALLVRGTQWAASGKVTLVQAGPH
jgi:type 1 glutamine amidotransferase